MHLLHDHKTKFHELFATFLHEVIFVFFKEDEQNLEKEEFDVWIFNDYKLIQIF